MSLHSVYRFDATAFMKIRRISHRWIFMPTDHPFSTRAGQRQLQAYREKGGR